MKNLNEIKSQINKAEINKSAVIEALVLKNIKGGKKCPPPFD